MTAMYHDIHTNKTLNETLSNNRVLGTDYDELLFADDTILFSEDAKALETLLKKVEIHG